MIPALLDVQQTMLRLTLHAIVSLFAHIAPLIRFSTIGSNYETTHCQQCPDNLNTCTECMSGYMLRPNGTCGTACPNEYFYSKKKCISASVRITPVLQAIIDAGGERVHWLLAETVILLMMVFINY